MPAEGGCPEGPERRSRAGAHRVLAEVTPSDLHEGSTSLKKRKCLRPHPEHDLTQFLIRDVTRSNPHYLRRRTMLLQQLRKIGVLRDDDGIDPACGGENGRVSSREEIEILHMSSIGSVVITKPIRQRWRELGIDPELQRPRLAIGTGARRGRHTDLRRQNGMIQLARRVEKARRDVIWLKIGVVREDLLLRFPSSQQLKHIKHAEPHPTDARTTAALLRIDRDPD